MVPSFNYQILVRGSAAVTLATAVVLASLPESAVTQEMLVEKAQFTFGVLTTIFAALLKLPEQYRLKLLDRFAGGSERDQVFTGLSCAALAIASVSFFYPRLGRVPWRKPGNHEHNRWRVLRRVCVLGWQH